MPSPGPVRLSRVPAAREHALIASVLRPTQAAMAVLVLSASLAAGCGGQGAPSSAATGTTTAAPQPVPQRDDGERRGTVPAPTEPSAKRTGPRPAPAEARARVARPPIVSRYIPFDAARKRDMAAYALRHYGVRGYRLVDPHVIVEHFTVTDSVQATYNTFAPNVADVELHELPGVCSHFVIARDGTIDQLVPLELMCRHTVGLNYTAIGIEHVGRSDAEILQSAGQLSASLRLTNWLRCRYDIKIENVIGHSESLSSPYHHENVARLRSQTHADFARAAMQTYRGKLRRLRCT